MSAKSFLFSTVAAGLMLPAVPSAAETRTAAPLALDEIIVTARKRQESILRVPVIENVVTQEVMEQHQIGDLTGLSNQVPGLSMGAAVLAIGPQISIRGVGTSTLDAGVDQSVSLNVDGLSMTQGLAYAAGLFDLAQAEVLKGPQALFFGKNSPGGVISLRTADPGHRTEVIAGVAREFEAQEQEYKLIVSTPVTDTFGIRLAGKFSDDDGFFYNKSYAAPGTGARTPDSDRLGSTRSNMLRITGVWKPTDAFDTRLKANWTKDFTNGNASMGQLTGCPDGTANVAVGGGTIPFINPSDNCKLDRTAYLISVDPAAFPGIRNGGTPFFDLTQRFGTLEMNYRTESNTTFTSVSGYYHATVDTMINGVLSGFAAPALTADNNFYRTDYTQEFRVNSDSPSPLNYTVGAFYQSAQLNNRVIVNGNTAYGLPGVLTAGSQKLGINSYSLFGQGRYQATESLELAAGVRWAHEKRTDAPYSLAAGGALRPVPVAIAPVKPNITATNYSPEITVTYTPNDNMTVFGSLKQGYKSGSYTITTPVTAGTDNSFGDEKIRGGEAGVKSRFLNRSLSLNVAGYFYDYKGLQVGTNEPAQNGIPIIKTLNAGGARIYGVDMDMAWRLPGIQGMTVNSALNWNHARFTELKNVPCWGGQTIAMGCNAVLNPSTNLFTAQADLSGLELVRAPDWQVNAGADYEVPLLNDVKLNLGLDAQYTSKYRAALNDRQDSYQPGYTMVNANLRLSGNDGRWEVALIGNNINNKITTGSCTTLNYARGQILGGEVTGGTTAGPAGIDETTCVAKRGRELWLRVTLKAFGASN